MFLFLVSAFTFFLQSVFVAAAISRPSSMCWCSERFGTRVFMCMCREGAEAACGSLQFPRWAILPKYNICRSRDKRTRWWNSGYSNVLIRSLKAQVIFSPWIHLLNVPQIDFIHIPLGQTWLQFMETSSCFMKKLNAAILTKACWFINVAMLRAVEKHFFFFFFLADDKTLLLEVDSYRVQRGNKWFQ